MGRAWQCRAKLHTAVCSRRVLQTSLWVIENEFISHSGVSGTTKNKIQYANITRLVTSHVVEYIKRYCHTRRNDFIVIRIMWIQQYRWAGVVYRRRELLLKTVFRTYSRRIAFDHARLRCNNIAILYYILWETSRLS